MKFKFLAPILLIALPVFSASTPKANFKSLCPEMLQGQDAEPLLCKKLTTHFFSSTKENAPIEIVRPEQVGAPGMEIDPKIQFVVFNDANYFPGVAYCYFVFRGWLQTSKMSPDALALAASGFSILNEEVAGYQKWLATNPEGKACKQQIQGESKVPVTDLSALLKNHVAIIGLNPLASLHNGHASYQAVMKDMQLTLNHERVHAYQVICPELEAWGQVKWKELSTDEKKKFPVVYPSYNWDDLKVAGREYVAFSFENKPAELLQHLGKCRSR